MSIEAKEKLARIMGTFDLATGHGDTIDELLNALESELRDVLGYYRQMRTWVGLTDEEVNEIYISVEEKVNEHWENGGTTMMFPLTLYKAIEQALKEKNNA